MNDTIPKIGDLLVPLALYPHLDPEETVGDAVTSLLAHRTDDGRHLHYDEVFIVKQAEILVGRLTVRQMLISFFPSLLATETKQTYLGKQQQFFDLSILMEDSFQKGCQRQSMVRVDECMQRVDRAIDPGMHPLHALEIMVAGNQLTLPVIESGRLLGAVRMNDLFQVLGGLCTVTADPGSGNTQQGEHHE
jgi:Mg/Co/Ni transporter MgtE